MTVKVTQISMSALLQQADIETETWISNVFVEVLSDAPPPGQVHFHGVEFSHPVYDDANVVIEEGDRAAFDTHQYPTKHASDLYASTPKQHNPWPASSGYAPVSDGNKYVATQISLASHSHNIQVIGTREGDLEVSTSPLRVYNKYGATKTISQVFVSVNTAPTGADVRIDVLKDGVSIFAADGDKPTITATNYTGSSTTFDDDQWLSDEYLQIEVETIGSTLPGSDLTVHIVTS